MRTRTLLLSLVLFILPGVLRADPPDRVARLGYFSGSVSFRAADLDDWAPASANYPLTEGDHLWTDDEARGELHVGGSTVVRLAPHTAFSFLNLDDDTTQMRISEGGVAVTIEDLDRNEVVEVDTPDAAVSLLERGFYLVRVSEDGYETIVTVRRGVAEVAAGGASVVVHAGDALVIQGGDSPRYDVRDADASNDWEDWCLERDRRYERSESRRYVSTGFVGYQDLDDHGRWRDDSEYGHVWVPSTVVVDWAPYRYGHWAFVYPWGWTWVDDSPWGFAPFHYGRWAHRPWGWCWVPGRAVKRPVYAPALVAFVGGADFSISVVAGGGVGWFPLGPREVYVPPYTASPRYIQNINVTNVTNITNINVTNINVTNVNYANRHVGGAVTVVDNATFVGSRPVQRGIVSVSTQNMARARVQRSVVTTLKPRRESILGASMTSGAVRRPSVQVEERRVVTRVKPRAPRARVAVEGTRPVPVRQQLVKPAFDQARDNRLRPAREGLPQAHTVRPGERPRPVPSGRNENAPATTKPSTRPSPGQRPGNTDPPQIDDRNTGRPKPTQRPDADERPTTKPADRGDQAPPFRPAERPTNMPSARPSPEQRPSNTRPPQIDDRNNGRPKATPRPEADERPTTKPSDRGNQAPPFRPTERPTAKPSAPPSQENRPGRPPQIDDRNNGRPKATPRPEADERPTTKPSDRGNQAPPFRPPSTRPSDRPESEEKPTVSKSPTPERSPRGEATPKPTRESDKPKGKGAKPTPSPSPSPKRDRR